MLEDEIYPLLEERGRAVPVERMLQDEDLVGDEKLLLTLDIYVEVRIALVEIVDGELDPTNLC